MTDVWAVDLTDPRLRGEDAIAVLDETERARWRRFFRDETRAQFAAAHAALRHILAGTTGAAAADLSFVSGPCPNCGEPHGRPQLRDEPGVHFNLSHTRDLAFIAVSRDAVVGIDVEFMRPNVNNAGVSRRFFSAGEQAELDALPADHRLAAFFRLWVRKEAVLKGSGHGIGGGLTVPAGALGDRSATVEGADGRPWLVSDLDAPAAYAAAVAVAEPHPTVTLHSW